MKMNKRLKFKSIFALVFKTSNINNISNSRKKKKIKVRSNIYSLLLTGLIMTFITTLLTLTQAISTLEGISELYPDDFLILKESISDSISSATFSNFILANFAIGVTSVFTILFLGNDDSYFIHLPISSKHYFLSKFLTALISIGIISFSVPLGHFINNCIFYKYLNFYSSLNVFIIYIGMALFISGFIFLFGMFLSQVCKLKKHRNAMTAVYYIVLFCAIFVFGIFRFFDQYNTSTNSSLGKIDIINYLFAGKDSMSVFYSSLTIVAGILINLFSYLIGKNYYLNSILGMYDNPKKLKKKEFKNKENSDEMDELIFKKVYKKRSLFMRLIDHEYSTLFKNPSILLNTLVPELFSKVAIFITIIALYLNIITPAINSVPGNIPSQIQLVMNVFLLLYFITNIMMMHAPIMYSKDQLNSVYLYSTPAKQKAILHSKLLAPALVLMPIDIIFMITISILASRLITPMTIIAMVFTYLTSFMSLSYLGIYLDLKFGNSTSTNLLALTKQSKQVILMMLSAFLYYAIVYVAPFVISIFVDSIYLLIISPLLSLICFSLISIYVEKNLSVMLLRFFQN